MRVRFIGGRSNSWAQKKHANHYPYDRAYATRLAQPRLFQEQTLE